MATASTALQTAPFPAPQNTGGALATRAGNMPATMGGDGNSMTLSSIMAQGAGPLETARQVLQQPAVRKALPVMVLALALLAFALVYTAINSTTYRQVSVGSTEADQQAAFEALKAGEFKPVLEAGSGQITVPSQRYHEARLYLASKGLPKTGQTGLDSLKDQSALTTSQFMEQVRYNAAMEQELARTITQIDSIQSARVHLAMTKPSVFVRDRTPPKASVVVTPFAGRTISPAQVQALVHLVASSVPLLTPENVTVVDNVGKMITDASADPAIGMNAGQTKHKQSIEELYRQRVIQILAPIVGDDNVRSQVNLTLDFSQTETTQEDFDTRDKGPKTRSEVRSEDRNSAKEAGGIPGALANTAPAAPTTSLNTSSAPASAPAGSDDKTMTTLRSTRNFELDRSVRHTKSATGNIQRLSVAVVVNERAPIQQPKDANGAAVDPKPNPFTPEEVQRMQELVRGVVGFNEDRDDVVTVVQAKFEPQAPVDLSVAWYKDESTVTNIKSGLLGVLFVAFLLVVVKPTVTHLLTRDQVAAEASAAEIAAQAEELALTAEAEGLSKDSGKTLEEMKADLKAKKSTGISVELMDTANTYDDKVALVRMIVDEDQARVAAVLKNMIKIG